MCITWKKVAVAKLKPATEVSKVLALKRHKIIININAQHFLLHS